MNEKSDPCDNRARNSHRDAGPRRIRRAPDELDSGSRIRIDKRSSANYHSRHGGVKWQAGYPQWLPKPAPQTGDGSIRAVFFQKHMVRRRTNISTKDNHHDRKHPQDFARIRSAHGAPRRPRPHGLRALRERASRRRGRSVRAPAREERGGLRRPRRRGAARVLRTTTAAPATKRRPGSEPTQNSPSRAHKRRQKLDVGRALREDPASCGRSCTHPYQPACADGLLRLRSFVRAGSIGNFPSTPFLTLALSSRVSYSVDTRAPGPDGAAPKQESKKENP